MGATINGQTVDMPLIRSKYALWRNSNNIITLRHSVKDAARSTIDIPGQAEGTTSS